MIKTNPKLNPKKKTYGNSLGTTMRISTLVNHM